MPYYSLSQAIKLKVKSAVSYVNDYEEQLAAMAKIKKCDGIICGHIHQPALKEINGVMYMNSGDWVESLTALAETHEGEWKLVSFEDKLIDDSQPEEEEDGDLENSSYIEDLMMLREEMKQLKKTSPSK